MGFFKKAQSGGEKWQKNNPQIPPLHVLQPTMSHPQSTTTITTITAKSPLMCCQQLPEMLLATLLIQQLLQLGRLGPWLPSGHQTWEKNGKTGILGQFMLICPLFWFLCFCSMFLPYL